MSEHSKVEIVKHDSDQCQFVDSVKDVQSGSGVIRSYSGVGRS